MDCATSAWQSPSRYESVAADFHQCFLAFTRVFHGAFSREQDLEHIFTFFDQDRSGTISFSEFLDGLRGPLSRTRQKLIKLAFRKLDGTRTGRVALADMRSAYDTTLHPDVLAGRQTKDEALREFMTQVGLCVSFCPKTPTNFGSLLRSYLLFFSLSLVSLFFPFLQSPLP